MHCNPRLLCSMQLYIVIEFIQISGNQFKMKQLSFFQIFAVALITCSCTTLKRYDSVQSSGTDNNLANIDLFGFEVSRARPETGIKTLWDLSADAQSQFIKILNSRFPDNEKFIKALSYEYLKPNTALILTIIQAGICEWYFPSASDLDSGRGTVRQALIFHPRTE
jgi:hypothetical protein